MSEESTPVVEETAKDNEEQENLTSPKIGGKVVKLMRVTQSMTFQFGDLGHFMAKVIVVQEGEDLHLDKYFTCSKQVSDIKVDWYPNKNGDQETINAWEDVIQSVCDEIGDNVEELVKGEINMYDFEKRMTEFCKKKNVELGYNTRKPTT